MLNVILDYISDSTAVWRILSWNRHHCVLGWQFAVGQLTTLTVSYPEVVGLLLM
jgi:hypothetical protein